MGFLQGLIVINDKLQKEIEECNKISTENNSDGKEIIILLKDYQNLLYKRVNLLYSILISLHNKAEGIKVKYSFFAYRSDIKKLGNLEKHTNIIGQNLQAVAAPFMREYR